MISEAVRALRRLTDPFRRSTWWPRRRPSRSDAPGVLFVSFYHIDGPARQKLLTRYLEHQRQPLTSSERPEVLSQSDREPDGALEFFHQVTVLVLRTIVFSPQLWSGRLSWARHLCECQAMARVQQEIFRGEPVLHLGGLRSHRWRDVHHLERLVRHLDLRRYEIWLIFRARQEAYLPASLPLPEEPLSVGELRRLAGHRCRPDQLVEGVTARPPEPGVLRLMSYNVHSCIGLDGKHSVRRIAEVLERYRPDIVALQEVDRGCRRTECRDQLEELVKLWPAEYAYLATLDRDGGRYGLALLSRHRILSSRGRMLPLVPRLVGQEQRGLQIAKIACPGVGALTVFNTHLGLTPPERRLQTRTLCDLLEDCPGPLVLLGDLNCGWKSPEYQKLSQALTPSQEKPVPTWFGTYPVRVLDHIFLRDLPYKWRTFAPNDSLTRIASDHLPLICDLKFHDPKPEPEGC